MCCWLFDGCCCVGCCWVVWFGVVNWCLMLCIVSFGRKWGLLILNLCIFFMWMVVWNVIMCLLWVCCVVCMYVWVGKLCCVVGLVLMWCCIGWWVCWCSVLFVSLWICVLCVVCYWCWLSVFCCFVEFGDWWLCIMCEFLCEDF